MEEIWKDIPEYKGLYQISNLGRIKSFPRNGTIKQEKILKQTKDNNDYMVVVLYKNNKPTKYCIHRLVAKAFLENKIREYYCIGEASKKTNICRSSISRCCSKKLRFAGNYIWRFKEDYYG